MQSGLRVSKACCLRHLPSYPSEYSCAWSTAVQFVRPRCSYPCARANSVRGPHSFLLDSDTLDFLDRFWEARGVFDPQQRAKLVEVATRAYEAGDESSGRLDGLLDSDSLPGVTTTWELEPRGKHVAALCQRLEQLYNLLGRRQDVNLGVMCAKEPGLLTADIKQLGRRLLEMKLSSLHESIDIMKTIEQQPHLLLELGARVDPQESSDKLLQAWKFGLLSDTEEEWERGYALLASYSETQGDPHVGYRDGDDPYLSRWAEKQRDAFLRGELGAEQVARLNALSFEFDGADAEWMRWFRQLKAHQDTTGVCPTTLASGTNFLLINWCSVQRVARRAGVLGSRREELLDSIGFDWTAADALS